MNKEVEISVGDIKAVLEIITVMASRGAIKGSELAAIGSIYNKYLSLLETLQKKEPAPAEDIKDN